MLDDPKSVTEAVIQSVAAETQTDPLELPPLYDTVDPDLLEKFSDLSVDEGSSIDTWMLSFEYADCEVRLDTGDCEAISRPEASPRR